MIRVSVVYALAERQTVVDIDLPDDTKAARAVEASGIFHKHPELAGRRLDLGVFGEVVTADTTLADGDRVEILRPLAAGPREQRRRRVRARDGA